LSFALMLKFFEIEGRLPRHPGELPSVAVDFVARQLGVPAAGFEVTGRAVERYPVPIRDVLGFRVFSRGDEHKMISGLRRRSGRASASRGRAIPSGSSSGRCSVTATILIPAGCRMSWGGCGRTLPPCGTLPLSAGWSPREARLRRHRAARYVVEEAKTLAKLAELYLFQGRFVEGLALPGPVGCPARRASA
jgi:hypothetical protein